MNLEESAVGRLLRMEEVIPAMERALADFSSGTVVQPVRTMLPVAEYGGFLGLMPAYTGSALGAKLVAFYPRNTSVPTHHATILLFDAGAIRKVALAGGAHQRGGRASPRLERARRRGAAPRQGLRGLAGGRYEGERGRDRSQGGTRRDRRGGLWSGARSPILRGGDAVQVARTGGGGRGYGRVGLPQCPGRRVAAVLSRLFTEVPGSRFSEVGLPFYGVPKSSRVESQ